VCEQSKKDLQGIMCKHLAVSSLKKTLLLQNHRTVWVVRDLYRSSSPTSPATSRDIFN